HGERPESGHQLHLEFAVRALGPLHGAALGESRTALDSASSCLHGLSGRIVRRPGRAREIQRRIGEHGGVGRYVPTSAGRDSCKL
ncbi:hypothetical protein LTR39_005493, partial [Cryomyces antarcticus]